MRKTMPIKKLKELKNTLLDLIPKLPDEDQCASQENDLIADVINLKTSLDQYLQEISND